MKRFTPCVLAALFTLPSLQAMAAADLVFTNGKVFTGVPGQALVNAVAVENGKIMKVGSDDEVNALADAKTRRIDLAPATSSPVKAGTTRAISRPPSTCTACCSGASTSTT